MLVPLSWLKEYIKIPVTAEKLSERLLLAGTKVEEITKVGVTVVLNLEITPNRPDTLSIYGVAREVAAIFNEELLPLQADPLKELKVKGSKPTIKVVNKKLLPHYTLVKVNDVFIKDSPEWMKDYLLAAGVRPINNIVDITNFLMLELGQPMHAFDADKIKGQMTMRAAKKGEKVKTLDSIERVLNEGAIIIEDEEKLIDLAGLMGGENSEVSSTTKNVLLLVPVYESVTIRKTSLYLNLRTEASNRFEKKLDPNLHEFASRRAVKLLSELANAQSISPESSTPLQEKNRTIEFKPSLVKEALGLDISEKDIINLLSPLGFMVSPSFVEDSLTIQIPSWRQDVTLEEDILEELGRIYGYNNFPKTLPSGTIPVQKDTFLPNNFDKIRDEALRNGFTELTGYTLVPKKDLDNFLIPEDKALKVLYPTSSDFEYLRPTLLINLLKAVSTNHTKSKSLSFFEIGKEFSKEVDTSNKLPKQKVALGLATTKSFRELKGVVETILKPFNLKLTQEKTGDTLSNGVTFKIGAKLVAKIVEIDKNLLAKYDINFPVHSAWVDFAYLENLPSHTKYIPENKFPPVIEDISFFLGKIGSTDEIIEKLENIHPLIKKVDFIDSFVKDSKTSITLRIYYADPSKTLTTQEVEKVRKVVNKELTSKFKVTLRED